MTEELYPVSEDVMKLTKKLNPAAADVLTVSQHRGNPMTWLDSQVGELLARNLDKKIKALTRSPDAKINKYHVSAPEDRTYNSRVYPSKKQANYAAGLDLAKVAGEVSFYLEEVPIRLPGGKVYRLDFLVFKQVKNTPLFEVRWVEVKGHRIATGEVKRSVAAAVLGIEIEVV